MSPQFCSSWLKMDVMDIDEWMQLMQTLCSAPDRFLEAEAKSHSDGMRKRAISVKIAETEMMLGRAGSDKAK